MESQLKSNIGKHFSQGFPERLQAANCLILHAKKPATGAKVDDRTVPTGCFPGGICPLPCFNCRMTIVACGFMNANAG